MNEKAPRPKILIIEDEVILAASMERELFRRGFRTCETACSEAEAVEKAKREIPDLIILDCCLGCEDSGFKTAERIRSFCDVPIVFMSGLHQADIASQLNAFRRSAFLPKPFTPDALIQIIERTIDTYLGDASDASPD